MAGSSSIITYDNGVDGAGYRNGIRKIIVAWTSDASDGHCTPVTQKIVGRLIKAVTVPGAAGAAPSDNYDITITETTNANDVLANSQSTLQNRDTANTEEVYFLELNTAATALATDVQPVVCDTLTISIANAGNSKTGTLTLYYSPQ